MWANGFAPTSNAQHALFLGGLGTGDTNKWQTWAKPPGAQFAIINMVGGGGAGGGPLGTIGLSNNGGGGGGSGGYSSLFIPLVFLPDILFIYAGNGGLCPTININGQGGEASWVCVSPTATAALGILTANGGGGGGGGTTSTAGTAAAAATATSAMFSTFGLGYYVAGQAGGAGGNGGAGGSVTPAANLVTTGGGGGSDSGPENGGSVLAVTGLSPIVQGGRGAGGFPGEKGADGYVLGFIGVGPKGSPLVLRGGAGGSGSNTTNSSIGSGNGALGCGGGGGVDGTTSDLNTRVGGAGGPGFIIISAW